MRLPKKYWNIPHYIVLRNTEIYHIIIGTCLCSCSRRKPLKRIMSRLCCTCSFRLPMEVMCGQRTRLCKILIVGFWSWCIRQIVREGHVSRHRKPKLLQNSRRQTLVCMKQLFLLVKRKSRLLFCAKPWRTAKTPETLKGVMSSRKAWLMLKSAISKSLRSNQKPNAGLNLTTGRRLPVPPQAAQHVWARRVLSEIYICICTCTCCIWYVI